jgi:hypothetical protein
MRIILKKTEKAVKYLLAIVFTFSGVLSYAVMSIAPKVWDDMVVFFFLPYIPLILAIVVSWDVIAEKRAVHKILGSILVLLNLMFLLLTWVNINPF